MNQRLIIRQVMEFFSLSVLLCRDRKSQHNNAHYVEIVEDWKGQETVYWIIDEGMREWLIDW